MAIMAPNRTAREYSLPSDEESAVTAAIAGRPPRNGSREPSRAGAVLAVPRYGGTSQPLGVPGQAPRSHRSYDTPRYERPPSGSERPEEIAMETQSPQVPTPSDDPADQSARGVGRAIAFEVGYSHTVDEHALNTARGYATMAGDSLGRDARSCLRYGNAAAAAFDSLIFEFAIVAIVTAFRSWTSFERLQMQLAVTNRDSRGELTRRSQRAGRAPGTDRCAWRGQIG